MLDLHGLHMSEALSLVRKQLDVARAEGKQYLRLAMALGSHVKVGKRINQGPAGRRAAGAVAVTRTVHVVVK